MKGNLPKPLKKQREVLYLPSTGHSAVLGTAGSGKTTLALYRAAYLSDSSMPHAGRTLLLTFNKALVTYLNYLKPFELRNVQIENYHTFARGYLNSRGKMQFNCICGDSDERMHYIKQAITDVSQQYKPSKFFQRPIEFFSDEVQWILCNGIEKTEDYVAVERTGRTGTNLSRKLRPVMYEILVKYLELRNAGGNLYDWDDISFHTRKEFEADVSERRYRHIIVDEGQDFSPEMLRSLVAAVPDNGSLTFFGDVAQEIYGQRMSWRSAGLNIPQTWDFKENYRNTRQIARLALAISQMPFFRDIPDLVEPTSPTADGPLPTVAKCSDERHQIDWAIKVANANTSTKSVAILVKNREQEQYFQNRLTGASRLHRDLSHWNAGTGVFHGTYHSAKGLEFDMVILPFLDDDNLPDKDYIAAHDEDEAMVHDARLLYVAVTRARKELVLFHSSELTTLLPRDESLYKEVQS